MRRSFRAPSPPSRSSSPRPGTASPATETIRIRPGFQQIWIGRCLALSVEIRYPRGPAASPRRGILVVGKRRGKPTWSCGKEWRTVWHVEVGSGKEVDRRGSRGFAGAFRVDRLRGGRSVILSGPVTTSQDKTVLEAYASAHPGSTSGSPCPRRRKPSSLRPEIIEISRGETAQLGIRWPDALSAKGTFVVERKRGDVYRRHGLRGATESVMANGKARILSNPRLACESGGEAQFLRGGKSPS